MLSFVVTNTIARLPWPRTVETPSGGPLITDRPDQTESSVTVSPGAMQLEIGWTYTRDDETGFERRSHALPQTIVRVGAVPRLEARFGFAGWIRDEVTDAAQLLTSEGIGDLDLGFKYQIVDGGGTSPDVAVLTTVSIPTGEDQVSSGRADPTVRLLIAGDLNERLSLGVNVGSTWWSFQGNGTTETLVDALYTLVLGIGVSDQVGAFIESFGTFALDSDGSSAHSVDGGITWGVRDNVQFDFAGGVGLNDAADDWFIGAGISLRVPR